MNNQSLEPKDGDFVALVKQLEIKASAAMKKDTVETNVRHQAHIQKEALNETEAVNNQNFLKNISYEGSYEASYSDSAPDLTNSSYSSDNTEFENSHSAHKVSKSTNTSEMNTLDSGISNAKKAVSNNTANKITGSKANHTSSFIPFLIVAGIFVFFSLIVFSDDPERLISFFIPVFFALIFFNVFKNKTKNNS